MRTLILLMSILISVNSYAGGGTVGNGGDGFASEFVLTARLCVNILKNKDLSKITNFDLMKFSGAIETIEVHSEEKLMLNGNEVDAINYPSLKMIKLNRQRWMEMRGEKFTTSRLNLVIHEYLGVANFDDSNYSISNALIKLMGLSYFSPNSWWNPMNPTNNISVNVVKPEKSCSITDGGIYFDPSKESEEITYRTCEGYSLHVIKTSSAGGSAGLVGKYHSFKVSVISPTGQTLGKIQYTPEWGKCLVSNDKNCSQSGWFKIAEVQFRFDFVQ